MNSDAQRAQTRLRSLRAWPSPLLRRWNLRTATLDRRIREELQHLLHRRHRPVPPATRHVAGEDLIGHMDAAVLPEQGSEHTATAAPLMPTDNPGHTVAWVCGAAGWNMNIE